MNMKKDIFKNNSHPFTVPDGYFDTLHERIMNRIQAEENVKGQTLTRNRSVFASRSSFFTLHYRKLIAVAACILFIFAGAALRMTYMEKQLLVAGFAIDDEFYQWLYTSDGATIMAETLDVHIPENIITNETALSEEDEAIIHFFERDNINVAAILYSIDNETFLFH